MNLKPEDRFWSIDAIYEVAKDLELEVAPHAQDWPYENADDSDIETYIELYDAQTDSEKKFVIMDMIIEANTNQVSRTLLDQYWAETRKRLLENIKLHEYQIYYWCAFDELRLSDAWDISPYMRELWNSEKIG